MPAAEPQAPQPVTAGTPSAVVAELAAAAEFLRSPYFTAQIVQGIQHAAAQAVSPWLDRAGAAAYARCSTSEIDKAARDGVFARYERGGTPMFLKAELDEAIKSGKWKKKG